MTDLSTIIAEWRKNGTKGPFKVHMDGSGDLFVSNGDGEPVGVILEIGPKGEQGVNADADFFAAAPAMAARIEALEKERDEAEAHIVEFSEMAAALIEDMSKKPGTTWEQIKAAVRSLGDLGNRQAHRRMADRIEAMETTLTLIKEAYELRAELFTSDADCAASMYDRARAALGETSDD